MKVYLARYGRQSLLQWDDVEVSELQEYVRVLSEMIEGESLVTNVKEKA